MPSTVGLLLAAGAGRRFGGPKALVPGWLDHAVAALRDGGCDEVRVVLGAEAGLARPLVPAGVGVTVAVDWADGLGASFRAGLLALSLGEPDAVAALVHLVDLPDVGADVVRRVLSVGGGEHALARAAYGSVPGHPVLIGRAHWTDLIESVGGDAGARKHLGDHGAELVDCGDLATGSDVDERPQQR